jgi:hypothetical protein
VRRSEHTSDSKQLKIGFTLNAKIILKCKQPLFSVLVLFVRLEISSGGRFGISSGMVWLECVFR